MQTEQADAAEKALIKEFTDYLASVSREVVAPISANIARHQADIEKMLTKVADARSGVESEFDRQRGYLNTVRAQIDTIIKESELKIARLHSSSQALLDNSRQRIVSELTTVADQAGQTARKMGEVSERTSSAIDDHHHALQRLAEENSEVTTKILENATVALDQTFEGHRARLNESAGELIRQFDAIALDVKQTTERLWLAHDETRNRLFADFSSFTATVHAQIEAIHDTLRRDISNQIDGKSADVVKQVGAGITGQYAEQFAALTTEIRGGLVLVNESSQNQGELINLAIIKAVADISQSTVESQTTALGQLQREFANVKKWMGVIVVVVGAIVSAGLFLRF